MTKFFPLAICVLSLLLAACNDPNAQNNTPVLSYGIIAVESVPVGEFRLGFNPQMKRTIHAGDCEEYTISLKDKRGNLVPTPKEFNFRFTLLGSKGSGSFFTDPRCSNESVKEAKMAAGNSTFSFYIQEKSLGTVNLQVTVVKIGTLTSREITIIPGIVDKITIRDQFRGQTLTGQCHGSLSASFFDKFGNASTEGLDSVRIITNTGKVFLGNTCAGNSLDILPIKANQKTLSLSFMDETPITEPRFAAVSVYGLNLAGPDGTVVFQIQPVAQLSFLPPNHDFDKLGVGNSKEFEVELVNSSRVRPSNLSFENDGAFSIYPPKEGCGTLQAGRSCKLFVKFTPKISGAVRGYPGVRYFDGFKSRKISISLSGNGIMPGTLDDSFGDKGRIVAKMGAPFQNSFTKAMVVDKSCDDQNNPQCDFIYVAAEIDQGPVDKMGIGLARFDKDGKLDSSFGDSGIVGPIGSNQKVSTLSLLDDGSLLVAGTSDGIIHRAFTLTKFNSQDPFQHRSIKIEMAEGDLELKAIAQDENKIVLAGNMNYLDGTTPSDIAVVRLNSSLRLDTTFNANGNRPGIRLYNTLQLNQSNEDAVNAVVVQPDHKIIIGGYTRKNFPTLGSKQLLIARFNEDGSLDTNLDGDKKTYLGDQGFVTLAPEGGLDEEAYSVALQNTPTGKIRIVMATRSSARLPDSTLRERMVVYFVDSSAGSVSKMQVLDWGVRSNRDSLSDIIIQSDGKIVLAGSTSQSDGNGQSKAFAIARLTREGILDSDFKGEGILSGRVVTRFDDSLNGTGVALSIQSNGRILLGGTVTDLVGISQVGIARYWQ